jgi:tripartite-type tricarboxylate transporter receptor subunit TctC
MHGIQDPAERERAGATLPRRAMLLGAAAAGLASPALAQEAAWPVRQTRLIVPFAAGSVLDIPARIMADRLSRRLRATFIVESKPGAGGGLGSMEVVRAPADGSTLLVGSNSITILPFLQPRLGLDPIRDLVPISLLMDLPVGAAVKPDSQFRDLQDFVTKARAAPGRFTYGSGGVGSAVHLATAVFAAMAGIELLHVPYSGGARAMTALLSGEIDIFFTSTVDLLPAARQGSVKLVGVATERRMAAAPEVPTISEVVPGYTMLQWVGFFGPRGTPPAIVERLAAELALMRDDPELLARLAAGAAPVRFDGPAPLAERIAKDVEMWRQVIARERIQPE